MQNNPSHYKILIIGPAFPLRGGLASFDELFCQALIKEGHESAIVSYSLQYPNFLFPGSTQFDVSGKAPSGIKIHTLINSVNPFSWFKTARFIKKEKPDFVIIRFWIPFMGPALGTIARRIKKAGIKVIAITDNVIPHEKRAGDSIFTKYFIRACQGFVTMSDSVFKDLNVFTKSEHKIFLHHPLYTSFGEKLNKLEARKILDIAQNDKVILFFGLIRKYKGLDILLESMADERVKKMGIKLLIAGEFYEDRAYYDHIIHENKLENNIILHGKFIPNEEVKNYFSACDLVTLTYRNATQSGVTQVAFHFEKPVLVTNVGGLGEIIPHQKAGYVVEPDKKQIADALIDYYENNREEIFTKGMHVEKLKYDWCIFVNKIVNLYQQIK
jgi:D-inositol-3-phosphate glycosyltransferase